MRVASSKIAFASNAIAIVESAEILFLTAEANKQHSKPRMMKTYLGAIVLSSFGLELLLKSVHVFLNENDQFHSGHHLFNLSDNILKDQIATKFLSQRSVPLHPFLENHSNSFQDWRYFAENNKGKLNFEIDNVRALTKILKDIVMEYKNENT